MEQETLKRELISTARMRLEHYDKLVKLAEEQKSILVSGAHSELAQNLAHFDPLLLQLEQLDERERTLYEHLEKGQTGKRSANPSEIDAEHKDLADRAARKVLELRALTMTNKELLAGAKEFTDFSVGIICQIAAEQVRKDVSGNPAIVLDRKV